MQLSEDHGALAWSWKKMKLRRLQRRGEGVPRGDLQLFLSPSTKKEESVLGRLQRVWLSFQGRNIMEIKNKKNKKRVGAENLQTEQLRV